MSWIRSLRACRRRCAAAAVVLGLSISACSNSEPRGPTTVGATNVTVTGTVLERLDDIPYAYLRLGTDAGDVWVAVPTSDVTTRGRITITRGATLKGYWAPRIRKRFEELVFGTIERGR